MREKETRVKEWIQNIQDVEKYGYRSKNGTKRRLKQAKHLILFFGYTLFFIRTSNFSNETERS